MPVPKPDTRTDASPDARSAPRADDRSRRFDGTRPNEGATQASAVPDPTCDEAPATPADLFVAHRARVYRWAFALCGRHDEAIDAVQETFLRLLRGRVGFPGDPQARAWLRRTTTSTVIDRWRANSSRTALERDRVARGSPTSPSAAVERNELHDLLRAALSELSEHQRLVIVCRVYDHMTFNEIAEELNLAVPTAKTHYLRALERVRARLGPRLEEFTHD